MSSSAGSIFVDLLLNTFKFDEGTKRATRNTRQMASSIDSATKEIAKSFDFAKRALEAYIGFEALKHGAEFVRGQMEAIDANAKLAQSLNITTQAVADMSLVFDEAGAGAENLPKVLTAMQNALLGAAQGSKTQADAFKALGLSVADLIKLSPDEQFEKIADALSGVDNATLKVGYASDIFGAKLGRSLLPAMRDYKEAVADAAEFNEKFGISVDGIDSAKVEQANDAFGRIHKALEGIGNTIAVEVAPAITALSEAITGAAYDQNTLKEAVETSMDDFAALADVIRRAYSGVKLEISAIKVVATDVNEFVLTLLNKTQQGVADTLNLISPLTGKSFVPYINKNDISDAREASDVAKQEMRFAIKENEDAFSPGNNIQDKLMAARLRAERDATNRAIQDSIDRKNGGNPELTIKPDQEAIKAQKELQRLYDKNREYITGATAANIKYQDTLKDLNKLLQAGKITQDEYNAAVGRAQEEFDKASAKASGWGFDMKEAAKSASQSIQQSLADFLFDPADKGFKGMLKGFVDMLRRMQAEALSAQILQKLFGAGGLASGGGILGGVFNGIGKAIGLPGFAEGGYLGPGEWGIAGEKEAELIYGGRTGVTVIPPGKMGGGGNTYNIDARGADQGTVLRLQQALLMLAGPGVIERRVADAQQRGGL